MASDKTKQAAKAKAKEKRPAKAAGAGGATLPSVANHPRAAAQIARARAWGALAGFALVAFLSWHAGAPLAQTLERSLAAGVAVYVAAWACAVAVWRHLVVAELRAVRAHRAAQVAKRAAAAAAERAS